MEKMHGVPKVLLQFKNISFYFIQCHGRVMNCSFSLKNLETYFCTVTCKKKIVKVLVKLVKTIDNLPQHLSEKFIGDNLSITDISL